MPLEVNEIGIRLSVGDGASAQASSDDAPDGPRPLSGLERTALVEECVRRVLEELKRMQER